MVDPSGLFLFILVSVAGYIAFAVTGIHQAILQIHKAVLQLVDAAKEDESDEPDEAVDPALLRSPAALQALLDGFAEERRVIERGRADDLKLTSSEDRFSGICWADNALIELANREAKIRALLADKAPS